MLRIWVSIAAMLHPAAALRLIRVALQEWNVMFLISSARFIPNSWQRFLKTALEAMRASLNLAGLEKSTLILLGFSFKVMAGKRKSAIS